MTGARDAFADWVERARNTRLEEEAPPDAT
jgi:hypothetical protein